MLATQAEILKIVQFKTSRSGGSGGQHVNKVSSKVELVFNIEDAHFFTEAERALFKERLSNRLDKEGLLHVVAQEGRSQFLNKQTAVAKLMHILRSALQVQRKRKPTKIPRSVKEKRRSHKLMVGQKKENRRKPDLD